MSTPKDSFEWTADPEVVLLGTGPTYVVGTSEDHSLGTAAFGVVHKPLAELRADWRKILTQMRALVDESREVADDFRLDEVAFELGFSAEGKLVFVASAELSIAITATFRRRP